MACQAIIIKRWILMPHLSPIRWLIAILIFWGVIFTLAPILWWSSPSKLDITLKLSSNSTLSNWPWNLQDGWAINSKL